MTITTRLACSLVLLFVTLTAAASPTQWRRHFVARDRQHNLYFEGTEAVSLTDTTEENVVLLWDVGTARGIRLQRFADYEKKFTTILVEEVDGGSFFRIEFPLPFTAKTRMGVIDEARKNDTVMNVADAPLTFVTNSVRRTILESALKDPVTERALRTELRSSLSPAFLESLERLRDGLLTAPHVNGFDAIILRHLYWGGEAEPRVAFEVVNAAPDCRFDAEMGKPCSDEQVRRIAEAAKTGSEMITY